MLSHRILVFMTYKTDDSTEEGLPISSEYYLTRCHGPIGILALLTTCDIRHGELAMQEWTVVVSTNARIQHGIHDAYFCYLDLEPSAS